MTETTSAETTAAGATDSVASFTLRQRIKSMMAVISGNFLEWFDWTIFAILSPYLAANFFNPDDPTSGVLSTLLVFAGGFLARPIGGLLFGRLGDRLGRKFSLVVVMALMGAGSLMIALLPTYEAIGAWASVLLLVARLIQGLAHGGESGAAYTYMAEVAPAKRRGLWGSSVMLTIVLGVMAATLLGAVLTSVFDTTEMNEIGWRVAFFAGALLALFALLLRRAAAESEHYLNAREAERVNGKRPLSRRQITIIAVRITMLGLLTQVLYYTWMSFFSAYAISTKGMEPNGAYTASLLAQILALIALPFWGYVSDRIGRRRSLTAWAIAVMVIVFPVSWIVTDAPWTLFVAQSLALLVWAMQASIHSTVMAEQAPTETRATSVGVWTSIAAALTGGTAPYLNTWLTSIDLSWVFSLYIIVLAIATLVTIRFIPETAGLEMNEIPVPEDKRAVDRMAAQ